MSTLTRIGDRISDLLSKPEPPALSRFRQEMDLAMDRMWRAAWADPWAGADDRAGWPAVDVGEDDKALTLKVDVPGMEAKDLTVEVAGDLLTVRGSREEKAERSNGDRCRCERFAGSFARSVSLPAYVDADKVQARYEKGVLTVTAPKVPGKVPQPRQVPVQAATT